MQHRITFRSLLKRRAVSQHTISLEYDEHLGDIFWLNHIPSTNPAKTIPRLTISFFFFFLFWLPLDSHKCAAWVSELFLFHNTCLNPVHYCLLPDQPKEEKNCNVHKDTFPYLLFFSCSNSSFIMLVEYVINQQTSSVSWPLLKLME